MSESGEQNLPPGDAERVELERAIDLVGRDTRPGRLLRHLGDKYFQGRADQLTEFDIATQVFGRSLDSFDPADDAVVRVEAHRLRKKLAQVYESGAGQSGVRITLPAGTYVPQFSYAKEASLEAGLDAPASGPAPQPVRNAEPLPADTLLMGSSRRRRGFWAASVAVILVLLAGLQFWSRDSGDPLTAGANPAGKPSGPDTIADQIVAQTSGETPAESADGRIREIHLLSGYTRSEIIDPSGTRWVPDRYYSGGGTWPNSSSFIRGTSRPFIYSNWRNGEFTYELPMAPGIYELRLHFSSILRPGDEKLASFNIWLNNKPLLTAFDINIDAGATDVASVRVFRDVVPDARGIVRLRFGNAVGSPLLNGLELTPGTPGRLNPIRLTTQPTSFVDHKGQHWMADDFFINGLRSTELHTVSGTEDPELFSSERYGHFQYLIPVDTRGRYTVVLHFSEIYYGPQMVGGGGVGSRVFNVYANGRVLLQDFDIFKEAGSLKLVSKTFKNIRPTAQGKIKLLFEPVVNNATVSAIEVLEEAE